MAHGCQPQKDLRGCSSSCVTVSAPTANDLFGLARPLQSYLPSAAFVSPNGPERVEGGGYRWFDNGPNFGNVLHDVLAAAPALNTFADSELARLKLTPDRLIFVGFSQGATTVLNVGLRRKPRPIAVVAYAGARLSLENLPERFDITRSLPFIFSRAATFEFRGVPIFGKL